MTKVCFLSMDSLDGYVSDDALAIPQIAALGIGVETLSWRQTTTPWSDFAAIIIRTPWDYQKHPQQFLAVLTEIENQTALYNPLEIVRWNLTKTYLRDLEEKGVRIVPTLWNERYDAESFERWLNKLSSDTLIIKPTVSATAEHTYKLNRFDASLIPIFTERDFLVQPFLDPVVDEGEYSLFYFNGEYSHAILKEPKPNDFRVQEEHGGIITEIVANAELRAIAEDVIGKIGERLLYARVDLIRDNKGRFALMELELIEPSLYLRMNADAPSRFARAIADILSR